MGGILSDTLKVSKLFHTFNTDLVETNIPGLFPLLNSTCYSKSRPIKKNIENYRGL